MKGFNSIIRAAVFATALVMPMAGQADEPVDLNTAGVERLVELDGIEPGYA